MAARTVAGEAVLEGACAESADGANPCCLSPATKAGEPGNSDEVDGVDERGDRPVLPHAR